MPLAAAKITQSLAEKLPLPPAGYQLHWCPKTPGFGVRISATGDRAYIAERRVDGKTVRRTLGKASGAGAISTDSARALQLDVSSELQRGKDRLDERRERRLAEKQEAVTLDAALRDYVKRKRRANDGLALTPRTQADYLAMLEPAGVRASGKATLPGELCSLAKRPLHKITAADIRALHKALEPRGERRQTYGLQVLRAVLRFKGVEIVDNPLAATTAGDKRVALAPSRGDPSPIPIESLGAWWRAASKQKGVGAAQLKFQLLTGCRPGEASGITAGMVDLKGGRVTLPDTKNRKPLTIVLSTQALTILTPHVEGKKRSDLVFGVADAGKTLDTICAAACIERVSPHKLRHTFATVADDVVTAATLRAMLNHAGGDVTQVHYLGISEAKLRAGWQAVADFIEALPATEQA